MLATPSRAGAVPLACEVREYVLLGSSRYRQIDIVRTGSHGLIGG